MSPLLVPTLPTFFADRRLSFSTATTVIPQQSSRVFMEIFDCRLPIALPCDLGVQLSNVWHQCEVAELNSTSE